MSSPGGVSQEPKVPRARDGVLRGVLSWGAPRRRTAYVASAPFCAPKMAEKRQGLRPPEPLGLMWLRIRKSGGAVAKDCNNPFPVSIWEDAVSPSRGAHPRKRQSAVIYGRCPPEKPPAIPAIRQILLLARCSETYNEFSSPYR